jgi:thiamine-phosphate pyrophosphorylase
VTGNSHRPADGGPRFPRLYAIVDVDLCRLRGLEPLALAAAYARGGCRLLQIRQKGGTSGALLATARAAVADLRPLGVRVIVNDRADIAVMAGTDGVHVGQQDLPPDAVRRITGRGLLVGLSTHTREQIDDAPLHEVDYIAVGPVFRTTTKDTGYDPRGLGLLSFAAGRGRPVVAIGGITRENAAEAIAAGADTVAVISDLLAGDSPESRVREFLRRL